MARIYHPFRGRFLTKDPIGFAAGDTNLYRYVFNSPTNYTDPTGEYLGGILAPSNGQAVCALTGTVFGGALGGFPGAVGGGIIGSTIGGALFPPTKIPNDDLENWQIPSSLPPMSVPTTIGPPIHPNANPNRPTIGPKSPYSVPIRN